MLLQVEKLDFFIGSTQILRRISSNVNEREIVCLLGRNGAGKSSLIKNIIGLYSCRSGRILFQGKDITAYSPRQKVLAGMGYSPEDAKIFSDLTVEENINLSAWIRDHAEVEKKFSFETIFAIFPGIKNS